MRETEKQIENSILEYLAWRPNCFAFKFKDQAKFIGGRYRKNKWEINGVSDICCLVPNGRVIWLEVKTNIGRQSPSQKTFEKKINQFGGMYYVVRSVSDVKAILDNI